MSGFGRTRHSYMAKSGQARSGSGGAGNQGTLPSDTGGLPPSTHRPVRLRLAGVVVSLQEQWKTSIQKVFSDDPDLLNKSNQVGARQGLSGCRGLVRVLDKESVNQPSQPEQQSVEEVVLLVSELWKLSEVSWACGQWNCLQLKESEILLSSHSQKEVVTGEVSRLRTEGK